MDSSQQSKKKLPKNAEKYAMNFGLVGVSKLSSKESKSRMKLPNTVAVDPCDGQIEEKLKKVLEIKTLQKSMVTLLRPSVTDRSILTPQQFRKLPVGTPMYTAEQIDHLITDKLVVLGDYNVVIGLDAYGDTVILDTSVDPFDGKGLHVDEPQISNVAVGWWATNLAYRGTAVGKLAKTGDEYSTAIGYKATAIPERSSGRMTPG